MNLQPWLKVYVALALIAAAVFSPLALSFVPLIILLWYLVQWRWHFSSTINLMTQYFVFFALGLLFIPAIGPYFPLLIACPVLVLVDRALQEIGASGSRRATKNAWMPTGILVALLGNALLVLLISWALSVITLALASAIALLYLTVLLIIIFRYFPGRPVTEKPVQVRVVAGRELRQEINLDVKTRVGGALVLTSPYTWLKIRDPEMPLREGVLTTEISVSPSLSGPQGAELTACATDKWGLTQVRFTLEPLKLTVIPRAKYAEWIANKYLQGTKPGELPLASQIGFHKNQYGTRQGVEYYGNRIYQPGDTMRNIDWKHSIKYDEIVVKEFDEIRGRSAVMLINLTAGNEEERDILAHNILMTAVVLAQEAIPTSLAAYNQKETVLVTRPLHTGQLVLRAMRVVGDIVISPLPVKYLEPPDVNRLKANIWRLQDLESQQAGILRDLLAAEYKNLGDTARNNPSTQTLNKALALVNQQVTIIVISQRNHDAEALAYNMHTVTTNDAAFVAL